jgi:hypothetical protein
MKVSYRCGYGGAATCHRAAGYGSRNRVRTAPGAQALQHTAGEVSPNDSRAAAEEFAMHRAGYRM